MDEKARILKRNPTGGNKEPIALPRRPDRLSRNVRLMEPGDGKWGQGDDFAARENAQIKKGHKPSLTASG
ncbi:MAG: hypothetical protein ACYTBJ_15535 [Planctomycetota bacterium]